MTEETGMCRKCWQGGHGQIIGQPCVNAPRCDGIIQANPQFAEFVDVLPEPMTCRRRFDAYPGGIAVHSDQREGQDRWEKFKTNGQRVCSFCGSLHPQDFFALVEQAATTDRDADYHSTVNIDHSDKAYKVYVHQPGIRNAMEGGIKFYKQHLYGFEVSEEHQRLFKTALQLSTARFEKYLRTIPPRG